MVTLPPEKPTSAIWCWAQELGQPETCTRNPALRARAACWMSSAPRRGAGVSASEHTGPPVQTLTSRAWSASSSPRPSAASVVRTKGTSSIRTWRNMAFWFRVK